MAILDKEQKKKILNFLGKFSEIIRREGWVFHYDKDSDSLAIRKPTLSEDARKKYIDDEFAFYLTPKNDIQGLFLEYFTSNFISHHKNFRFVVKTLKSGKGSKSLVVLRGEKMRKFTPRLESVLIDSL